MMTLTDDQRMLADTVAPFLADEGAIPKQLRHWRDIGCKDGFGHGLQMFRAGTGREPAFGIEMKA